MVAVITLAGEEIDRLPVSFSPCAPRLTMDDAAYGLDLAYRNEQITEATMDAALAAIINGDTVELPEGIAITFTTTTI